MMNAFFRSAFSEYRRHKELKKTFVAQTAQLGSVLGKTAKFRKDLRSEHNLPESAALLVLMPLIEIAWADGRVTHREMDAITQAAETYHLVDDAAGYRELIERLLSRPIPNEVGRMWQDFHYFMKNLSLLDRETVTSALLAQAQFVAEQSTESVICFLRGERVCRDEQEALRVVALQLEKAKNAAEEADLERYVAAQAEKEKLLEATGVFFKQVEENSSVKNAIDETERRKMIDTLVAVETGIYQKRKQELSGAEKSNANTLEFTEAEPIASLDDSDKLIPLVPLVKVAWAEGRITKRERELIFSAAKRMGIEAGSPAYERLSSWLELHPTNEFYQESIERLNVAWSDLTEDEKNLRRLDLLSDCVNIAEASGGTRRYAAGGRRVCDEEFVAVKSVAEKLRVPSNAAAPVSLAA